MADNPNFWSNAKTSVSNSSGGIITSLINNVWNSIASARQRNWSEDMTDKQNQFNAEEAQKNRDFQVSERLATQAYNSPQQQIGRLRDAGVNPLSVFGSGYNNAQSQAMTGSQATSAGLPSYSRFNAQAMDVKDASTVRLQNAEARSIEISNDIQAKYGMSQAEASLYETWTRCGVNEETAKNLVKTGTLLNKDIAWYDDKARAEIYETLTRAGLNEEQAKVAMATAQKLQEECKWIEPQARALISLQASQVGVNMADLDAYDWNHAKVMTASMSASLGIDVDATLAKFGMNGSDSKSVQFLVIKNRKTGKYEVLNASVGLLGNGKVDESHRGVSSPNKDYGHLADGDGTQHPFYNPAFGHSQR